MEVFIILFIALFVCGGVYLTDRSGWNGTAKRLSRIVRAQIESAKPVKSLTRKAVTQELDSWETEFKQIQGIIPDSKLKHRIVKTGYYHAQSYGLWPRWWCKCGVSQYHALGGGSMSSAQREAKRAADHHVSEANKSEEMLAKTNGDFAW